MKKLQRAGFCSKKETYWATAKSEGSAYVLGSGRRCQPFGDQNKVNTAGTGYGERCPRTWGRAHLTSLRAPRRSTV